MALTLEIGDIATSITDETATISDATTYGSPNADRADVAVFIKVWKMDEDSVETELTVENTEPDVATEWSFTYDTDGWYKARLYVIPNWTSSNYAVDRVVYYSDGNIYKSILLGVGNPLPTNVTYFELITDYDDTVVTGNNVTADYFDFVLIEFAKKCAGDAASEWFKSKDCSNCDKLKLAESMLQKRAMVITAQRFDSIGLYSKAEGIARTLETNCESC